MSSFAVSLPLTRDSFDGFTNLKSIQHVVKQNLKMLLLTIPGEKVMTAANDSSYGVGLSTYLFSSNINFMKSEIEQKIKDQVSIYMPIVIIRSIRFTPLQDQNSISLTLSYDIPDIGTKDLIELVL